PGRAPTGRSGISARTPPTWPPRMPRGPRTPAPPATASTPTAIDVTAPAITRARRSRPYWSVPNGCPHDGPSRRPAIDMRSGSAGVHTSDTAATATSKTVIARPSANATWTRDPLLIPDPRVQPRVGEVHREVDGDDARGDEEAPALPHRQVARGDGAQGQTPETGQREDRLEDDAASQELAELDAAHRDDRDQGVPQR